MDTYLENISTTVGINWEEIFSKDIMSNIYTKKMISWESFCGELSLDVVSENGEWLDDFMVIWQLSGRKYGQLKKKLDEVAQLDDVTVNWKLVGSRSNWIIAG